jgi:hypothetical protein
MLRRRAGYASSMATESTSFFADDVSRLANVVTVLEKLCAIGSQNRSLPARKQAVLNT